MMKRWPVVLLLGVSLSASVAARQSGQGARALQSPERPDLERLADLEREIYRAVDGVELALWFCRPESAGATPRPAVVFFFGGGWRSGTPTQFAPHCRYLASRGMVAALADYRVADRHGVRVDQCVVDAKAAVRYLRRHAERLGIDPQRIAAGGGSAGGHLAAATATLPGFDDGSDGEVSSAPDALALFNPAVVLAPVEGLDNRSPEQLRQLRDRLGVEPESISPFHHLGAELPPTVVFHGTADKLVPHATVQLFCQRAEELGGRCHLLSYEGAGHGFFNASRDREAYVDTTVKLDHWFASLGWLEGEPTLAADGE